MIAATGQRDWRTRSYAEHNEGRLQDAIAAAGVEIGPYDQRIIGWFAGWEPQTVEVIAALIERAAGSAVHGESR